MIRSIIYSLALLVAYPVSVLAKNLHRYKEAAYIAFAVSLALLIVLTVSIVLVVKKTSSLRRKERFLDIETRIGNHAYFVRRFESDISDFSRENHCLSYFTVDGNYLHAYCPDILFTDVVRRLATVLQQNSRKYEFAARITESGFAMVFVGEEDSVKVRVNDILEKMNHFIDLSGVHGEKVFSAALYNLEKGDRECENLLFNLRIKCVSISGKNKQLIVCTADDINSVRRKKEFAERIRSGLKQNEFKMYVQFLVDNKSNKIVSAEALSRWENPELGILLPGKYIGEMMQSGIIADFDLYMFEQVCRQLERWKDTELSGVSLSCNLTRITISGKNFAEKISRISEKYSFNHDNLIMEITEDVLEENMERARRNIAECKKMGFKIALDDFGKGVTSPLNLCEYPLNIVKIDRQILLNTENTEKGKALFDGLVALAHKLNLNVVCEGVETLKQYEVVRDANCDYVQGWYFSRPIPVSAGEEFYREFSM